MDIKWIRTTSRKYGMKADIWEILLAFGERWEKKHSIKMVINSELGLAVEVYCDYRCIWWCWWRWWWQHKKFTNESGLTEVGNMKHVCIKLYPTQFHKCACSFRNTTDAKRYFCLRSSPANHVLIHRRHGSCNPNLQRFHRYYPEYVHNIRQEAPQRESQGVKGDGVADKGVGHVGIVPL